MNFQLTETFIKKIELLIENNKQDTLLQTCGQLLSPDIAEILKELTFSKAKYLFDLFSEERAAEILIELEEELRDQLLESLRAYPISYNEFFFIQYSLYISILFVLLILNILS